MLVELPKPLKPAVLIAPTVSSLREYHSRPRLHRGDIKGIDQRGGHDVSSPLFMILCLPLRPWNTWSHPSSQGSSAHVCDSLHALPAM